MYRSLVKGLSHAALYELMQAVCRKAIELARTALSPSIIPQESFSDVLHHFGEIFSSVLNIGKVYKAFASLVKYIAGFASTTKICFISLPNVSTAFNISTIVCQLVLDYYGYKKEAKYVGVAGKVLGGAISGSIAGPQGAIVGAGLGLLSWYLAENMTSWLNEHL